jgi:hypothetical protein
MPIPDQKDLKLMTACFCCQGGFFLPEDKKQMLKMKVSCQYPCGCVARCGIPFDEDVPLQLAILGKVLYPSAAAPAQATMDTASK